MKRAALLRGVNLGGRKLLMTDLAAICTALGYGSPRTLLASGNVVFDSDAPAAQIERELEAALAAHGLATDVLVRDHAELVAVAAGDPWPDATADHPSHVLVTFHRDAFPPEALDRLVAAHTGPERFRVAGRELYTDFRSQQGMRDSTLVGAMRKARFPTVATARNWNTVTKLAALTAPSER